MDNNFLYNILLLLVGSLYIASTTIGYQCNNECTEFSKNNPNNSGFLLTQLILGCVTVIGALISIYMNYRRPAITF